MYFAPQTLKPGYGPVPQCSHMPHWSCHQQHLVNCDWIPVYYTSGQPSYSHVHPNCWASLQRSHTVFSTLCHGASTSVLLSVNLSIELECMTWNRNTHLYLPHHNLSLQLTTTTVVQHTGLITDGMQVGWRTLWDTILSSLTSAPTILEWPCQEQCGSSLTTSVPVLNVSTPAHTNGVWPLWRLVSVAHKNRLFTMLSFIVYSSASQPLF